VVSKSEPSPSDDFVSFDFGGDHVFELVEDQFNFFAALVTGGLFECLGNSRSGRVVGRSQNVGNGLVE